MVIVIFTLVFIGPLYFLFTDGLKSTQEAIAAPPTLYRARLHPSRSSYSRACGRQRGGCFNTLYYAFGALAFQLVFDVAAAYSLSRLPSSARQRHPRADGRHADDPGHGADRPALYNGGATCRS